MSPVLRRHHPKRLDLKQPWGDQNSDLLFTSPKLLVERLDVFLFERVMHIKHPQDGEWSQHGYGRC
jgi:hypothetical protein